jgi:hypothetical protein
LKAKIIKIKTVREAKVPVSDSNISKAAVRLLSQRLVSTEVAYVQRTLGATATQQALDDQVMAVRKLPWSSIVVAD